jgi:hypothetical protein
METSRRKTALVLILILLLLAAIALFTLQTPERGSEAWCHMLENTPKGEWTAEDVKTFTYHCIGRSM